jgi:hypothetical protein
VRCNARRGGGQLHWRPRDAGLGTPSRIW